MNTYRIVEPFTERTVIEKDLKGDQTARNWLRGLLERGIITGIPVRLERKVISDSQAATLPPYANGKKQSQWKAL